MWLRDFLPDDIPEARILVYGYDTRIDDENARRSIVDIAKSFLDYIRAFRAATETTKRPIIFIAHSLGGLVVKEALSTASEDQDNFASRDIFISSCGLVFFGVPNSGLDLGQLRQITSKQPNNNLISDLYRDDDETEPSQYLEELDRKFVRTCQGQRPPFSIVSYHEMKKTTTPIINKNGKVTRDGQLRFVVTKSSAHRIGADDAFNQQQAIDADHRNLVKFPNRAGDYTRVLKSIRDLVRQSSKIVTQRAKNQGGGFDDRIEDASNFTCLRSLSYLGMHFRRHDTQRAHKNTCEWIFEHPSYCLWVKDARGLLWIQGKPGSGKSTLMESLLRRWEQQSSGNHSLQISYFFHGRGTFLQKSAIGMFRSILHQLLVQCPSVRGEYENAFEKRIRQEGKAQEDWEWHKNELRDFFSASIEQAAQKYPVHIFIDALDEACHEDNIQVDSSTPHAAHEIVSYFHQLNRRLYDSRYPITICFSCRHFPNIVTDQGHRLSVEDANHIDISTYITSKITSSRFSIETSEDEAELEKLHTSIIHQASGIFQWVHLVVNMMITYYDEGKTLNELRFMLKAVPKDLGDMYRHILTQVVNQDSKAETLCLMQRVCLAQKPLSLRELCAAICITDIDNFGSIIFAQSSTDSKIMQNQQKRIKSLSGGLVEVSHNETGEVVQFIHQSIIEFLLSRGFKILQSSALEGNVLGQSHDRLSKACLNYLQLEGLQELSELDIKQINVHFGFIKYATNYLFSHAEKAENLGVLQSHLIQYSESELFQRWFTLYMKIRWSEFDSKWEIRDLTLLHVASSSNLLSVTTGILTGGFDIETADAKGNRALHYAARWGCAEITEALLQRNCIIDIENWQGSTPLERAAANSHETVVRKLLQRGAGVNRRTINGGTALQGACLNGSRRIAKLLLDAGAEINAHGGLYGNALQAASIGGGKATVELLLERGAEINAQGGDYGNALQAASYKGDKVTVELLLERGAEINAQGGPYGNALQAASYKGDKATVELLLERGAEINAQGGQYGNALQAALFEEHMNTVELLLNNGADIHYLHPYYLIKQLANPVCSSINLQILLERGAKLNKFYSALQYGNSFQVESALQIGMPVDIPGNNEQYALHIAANGGYVKIIDLLMQDDSLVNLKNWKGQTPLWLAAQAGHVVVLDALLTHGNVYLNSQCVKGRTPLWEAAYSGMDESVRWLLEKGADPSIPDNDGVTPLSAALQKDYWRRVDGGSYDSIIQAIRAHGAK